MIEKLQEVEFLAIDMTRRARNWGLVCGFGYGYAAALLTFMILICVYH